MIKIKNNGDIDVKKLTPTELETLVDIRLDFYQRELNEIGTPTMQKR